MPPSAPPLKFLAGPLQDPQDRRSLQPNCVQRARLCLAQGLAYREALTSSLTKFSTT